MDNQTAAAVATLQANMSQSQGDITEIKSDVKDIVRTLSDMTDKFVSRSEFNEYKSKSTYTHLLSAIAGAALTGILGGFGYWLFFGLR